MSDFDEVLTSSVVACLSKLESQDKMVLIEPAEVLAKEIVEGVKHAYAGPVLSPEEIFGLCAMAMFAAKDKKFFDWEMPTLCGYSSEEMEEIIHKLRSTVNI